MEKGLIIFNNKVEHIKKYCLLAVVFLVIFFPFANFHLVTDTYNVIQDGYEEYSLNFIKDGRIISALAMQIGDILNIPIKVFITSMGIIAILIQTLSVYLIYSYLKSEYPNILFRKKYILLIGSALIVFNPMTIEHLAYTESAVITLGTLCCIISAIQINKQIKLKNCILISILTILAALCYQGTLNMFLTISILFLILKEGDRKDKLKKIGLILLFSMMALIFALIAIKIGNNILGTNQDANRILLNENVLKDKINILFFVIPTTTFTIIKTNFNLFPKYIMIITIVFTFALFILQKETRKNIWQYLLILLIAILSCMFPLFIMTSPCIEARMSGAIGAIIGISIIFWITQNKSDIAEKIIYIFTCLLLIISVYQYMQLERMNTITNGVEKQIGEQIKEEINQYEIITNKKVKKFSFCCDQKLSLTYINMPDNTFTARSLSRYYCIKNCVEYYTGHELEITNMDSNIYNKYFKDKNWDSFDIEQIVIKDDTLYMCIF